MIFKGVFDPFGKVVYYPDLIRREIVKANLSRGKDMRPSISCEEGEIKFPSLNERFRKTCHAELLLPGCSCLAELIRISC